MLFGFLLGGRATAVEVVGRSRGGNGYALCAVLAVVADATATVRTAQNSGAVDRFAGRRRRSALS